MTEVADNSQTYEFPTFESTTQVPQYVDETDFYITPSVNRNTVSPQMLLRYKQSSQYIYIISAILTFFSNFVTILTIMRSKRLQTPTNAYIVSLSVSDMLNSFSLTMLLLLAITPFGEAVRILASLAVFLNSLSAFMSLVTLFLIALDRFTAVLHPVKYKAKVMRDSLKRIAFSWIAGASVPLLVFSYTITKPLIFFTKPIQVPSLMPAWVLQAFVNFPTIALMMGAVALYGRVFHELRRRQNRVQDLTGAMSDHRAAKIARESKRTILMMSIILGAIICTWVPFNLLILLVSAEDLYSVPVAMFSYRVVATLLLANSFINPLVYAWTSASFRQAYIRLFMCQTEMSTVASLA